MRPILLLATAAVAVSARSATSHSRQVWNLPPTTSQESVAAFVQRVPRGGDQAGYKDSYDDRGHSNEDPHNQQYGNDDWDQQADDYPEDRYYEDRYDDRRRGGVEVREKCPVVILFRF
jgi:hypothetical protein